ncbi:F0F1 ATP synthase subunit gamma [Wolbachia endosymbiont of Cruorifilaria tuberocauda]|uniref:ATP synthase F1 subunit gamma n=1 Tax=Wolbachia endosymbiont of Cruorifilaria tuberocauda TaxID=1812111 RepID=UPI00158F027E|nr:ATP synthase F1 subunit gamma [Wolbachia endosymbiont of Cruorifilaria tuberocauda]QKX01873.1 F0F1 ATP synthase subunit gamma [Wolbachia endosymbiont of Cruorifilaria tuberocauda]
MKSLKELSLRIKNIKSVQKITRIMQMVSAAKLLQSQKKLSNSKLYISKLHNIIFSLLVSVNQESLVRILNIDNKNFYLVFIIASDRGMCGSFNSAIVKFSQEYINKLIVNGKRVDVIFFGKKAFDIGQNRFEHKCLLRVENSKGVTLRNIESLIDSVNFSKYNKIKVFYNKFYNAFTQKPVLETIKPWNKESSLINDSLFASIADYSYECEPQDAKFILQYLTRDYVIAALYSALLESAVSENNARMVAMESANKNAKEMLDKLALLYNRSRQTSITTDLIEVISGTEFL